MKNIVKAAVAASLILLLSGGAAAHPVSQAQAEQAARLTEAHAILDVMLPPDQRDAMLAKLQSDLVAQMMPKQADWMQEPGIKKIFDDFMAEALTKQRAVFARHMPEQLDAMAAAYARKFSLAELKDINAFAQSPSGRHYLSEMLAIVGDPEVAKANAAAVAEIRAVTSEMLPAFKEKVIAYVRAHPELTEKINAEAKSEENKPEQ